MREAIARVEAPMPTLIGSWKRESKWLLKDLASGPLCSDPIFHQALLLQQLQVQLPPPEAVILEAVQTGWLWLKLMAAVAERELRGLIPIADH